MHRPQLLLAGYKNNQKKTIHDSLNAVKTVLTLKIGKTDLLSKIAWTFPKGQGRIRAHIGPQF